MIASFEHCSSVEGLSRSATDDPGSQIIDRQLSAASVTVGFTRSPLIGSRHDGQRHHMVERPREWRLSCSLVSETPRF